MPASSPGAAGSCVRLDSHIVISPALPGNRRPGYAAPAGLSSGRPDPRGGVAMNAYDVVVIGAGHNGLTCAAYLARAGLKVRVVERRPVVGGAAVTEEFHPGFRNSVAAYTVGLLNPKIIDDLALHRYGLRIVERRAMNFVPVENGMTRAPRAVDVLDPEPGDLRGPEPSRICGGERGAALRARYRFEKLHDLVGAEHNWQLTEGR
jgi:hypothetical protein